jgi:hypothetical protein
LLPSDDAAYLLLADAITPRKAILSKLPAAGDVLRFYGRNGSFG